MSKWRPLLVVGEQEYRVRQIFLVTHEHVDGSVFDAMYVQM